MEGGRMGSPGGEVWVGVRRLGLHDQGHPGMTVSSPLQSPDPETLNLQPLPVVSTVKGKYEDPRVRGEGGAQAPRPAEPRTSREDGEQPLAEP